jgi:hypothetical protein
MSTQNRTPGAGQPSPAVRRRIVWTVLAGAVALAACGGGGPATNITPLAALAELRPADRLYYDNSGAIADSVRLVLRDRVAFADAWTRATSQQASPPAPPAVDFGEHMVVLVGAGRLTPEDRISVDSVGVRRVTDAGGESEEVLAVIVRTTVGCGRFDVDAYPVEIVRVPRFAGDVRFVERRSRAENCGPPDATGTR